MSDKDYIRIILSSLPNEPGIYQFYDLKDDQGLISGGAGMTWIDGKQYLTFHFNPEIAFGNVGIGLDLNLEFDQDGNLRTENFNTIEDYLAVS